MGLGLTLDLQLVCKDCRSSYLSQINSSQLTLSCIRKLFLAVYDGVIDILSTHQRQRHVTKQVLEELSMFDTLSDIASILNTYNLDFHVWELTPGLSS